MVVLLHATTLRLPYRSPVHRRLASSHRGAQEILKTSSPAWQQCSEFPQGPDGRISISSPHRGGQEADAFGLVFFWLASSFYAIGGPDILELQICHARSFFSHLHPRSQELPQTRPWDEAAVLVEYGPDAGGQIPYRDPYAIARRAS